MRLTRGGRFYTMVSKDMNVAASESGAESILCITETEQVGVGCVKVTAGTTCFFVRDAYLRRVTIAHITAGNTLVDEDATDVLDAALAFAAEKEAERYLARCEHSRAGLERKLLRKGMNRQTVALALDYLEARQYLSDARFAECWLRAHAYEKPQGRARLQSELCARGVSRQVADVALDAFFAEYSEHALCVRAVEKSLRAGRCGDKLVRHLQQSGFRYQQIQRALEAVSACGADDRFGGGD